MSRLRASLGPRDCAVLVGLLIAGALLVLVVPSGSADNRLNTNTHWGDGGRSQGFVNFIDRTGDAWAVYSAHLEWDNAGNVDVDYQPNNCDGRDHCVGVDAYNFGSGCGIRGFWQGTQQGGNHFNDAFIRLNNECKDNHSYRELRAIVCQEEGNVLGLGDEPQSLHQETCMGDGGPLGSTEETPRPHDFQMLDNVIYDHND